MNFGPKTWLPLDSLNLKIYCISVNFSASPISEHSASRNLRVRRGRKTPLGIREDDFLVNSPGLRRASLVLAAFLICFHIGPSSRAEPLGPSSRRTGLAITEIMYHPLPRTDGKNVEFVELYNSEPTPANIGGFRLTGDISFSFPAGTILPAFGFLLVAPAPADVESVYGISGVLGGFGVRGNALPNDQGKIRLRNRAGAILLEVNYSDDSPWPLAADGAGHSLVLARPSFGEGNAQAWGASAMAGGSPGTAEPDAATPLNAVRINEVLLRPAAGNAGYIELYNHSHEPVDLSGAVLTDDPALARFVIPPGTTIPASGFVALDEAALGFGLHAGGQKLYFVNAARTRVIDAARIPPQQMGVATGRIPDGAEGFRQLAANTPGAPNGSRRPSDVVINEIMYHSISGERDDQFVELHNRSGTAVDLSGWRLSGGISFIVPTHTMILPDGYLVVAANITQLLVNYPNLSTNNTVGNFEGRLSGRGERIVLSKPETLNTTNTAGALQTDIAFIPVEEITYGTGGRWPKWADGGGSSLERIDSRANPELASSWADSDETAKAPWAIVEHRGILDNGTGSADSLQVLLQGAGECLIDDVEVIDANGANRISNSSFEAGATGWTAEGTEAQSSVESKEGYNSAQSFHVRAVERGDDTVNRIRTPLSALAVGSAATIRAKVRWLRGAPQLLLRLRGNYLEAIAEMSVPKNLGTPGAPNSRAAANTAPAIYAVGHDPVLPAANQSVVVTARVDDPDGISQVILNYRIDPNTAFSSVPMLDDGTGGDAIGGDGIYSAIIPGQSSGALVAFSIGATDANSAPAMAHFPGDAPLHECLIRFGESKPAGTLGTYRLWMTQATFNTWRTRSPLNNAPLDVTFVYNDQRIIYNTQALYAGSPYISPGYNTPTGNLCGYTGSFPDDDVFLGTTDLVLDWPGRDSTAIQEQTAYWIADQVGLPNNYRRFIRLHVNGVTETQRGSIYEDVQQPGADIIKEWSPDDLDGQMFKIERWFEFSDSGSRIADPEPTLQKFLTTDLATGEQIKKLARYRWNWLPRAVKGSPNDYQNIFGLVDALNAAAPEPYTSNTEALIDIEQWMGIFAVEHIVNNFDSYGHEIGKNMYAYKPVHGKWQMHMFDIDWVMLASQGRYGTDGSLWVSNDPTISRMYNHPPFRRAYFRTVKKAVDGPLVAANVEPWLDAKYKALVSEGVTRSAGQALSSPAALKTWLQARRSYLQRQLDLVAAPFAITSNSGTDFSTGTNLVTLAGTAPIEIKGFRLNGSDYPVTWTTVTNWAMRLLLKPGVNDLGLSAYDAAGQVLTNYAGQIQIAYTGSDESPAGNVVINELMYHPVDPDAEFVELYNNSAKTGFDLSGWRLDGADFTFAPGTILSPNGYLVLAKDRVAFTAAYGVNIPIAGEFNGHLENNGETLTLIKPGPSLSQDTVVDRIAYSPELPWPAASGDSSLQRIDPAQTGFTPANWGVVTANTNVDVELQWQYVSVTGTASSSRVYIYMTSPGDVYIDDLKLVAGGTAEAGANAIVDGEFESAFPGAWTVSPNLSGSGLSTQVKHSGNSSLHIISTAAGSTASSAIWADVGPLVSNAAYTLSYWYRPSTNGSGLTIRLSGSGINSSHPIAPVKAASALATPGAVNSLSRSLPALPQLRLNEIEPNNQTGITDAAGQHEPWVELFNAGSTEIAMDGWRLTDDYNDLTKWSFPAGVKIQPGKYQLIWLDGEPQQTSGGELHANFRISPTSGKIGLVFPLNGQLAVLDFINYTDIIPDHSLGFPAEVDTAARQVLSVPSPGTANNSPAIPFQIFINEWMAANAGPIADPADGNFDDWFELYNPNAAPVDLTGYSISDNLTNAARWIVPPGTMIPAKGFLLVWADNEVAQNSPESSDLHAGFKLSQAGEAIALFAPNGTVVDSVTFAAQENGVSEGRWPDGAAQIQRLSNPTPRAANFGRASLDLQITGVRVVRNSELEISWNAQPGAMYRVEYKDDVNAADWIDFADVTAISETALFTTQSTASPQRFYRIKRVE